MKKLTCSFLLGVMSLLALPLSAQNWVNGGNALPANGTIGTNTNFAFIFKTNNADRGRITNGGNWGIGTASPVGKFHVNGNGAFGNRVTTLNATRALNLVADNAVMRVLRVHAADAPAVELISRTTPDGANVAYWDFYAEPSDKSFRIRDRVGAGLGLNRLTVTSPNGYVGIGTTTPSTQLHVVGRGRFTNGLTVDASGLKSTHATGNGVEGYGNSSTGSGVFGSGYTGVSGNGTVYGLFAQTSSSAGYGTLSYGGYGGVYGSGIQYGIYGHSSNYGMYGYTPGITDGSAGTGVKGYNNGFGYGVSGYCVNGSGIHGTSVNWYAGWFDGDVYSTGQYLGSDRKLKENIDELTSAMDIINKLQPKVYNYRQDANYKNMHLPKGKHFGLIAQDVEQVLPNLVRDAKFDSYAGLPQGLREDPKEGLTNQASARSVETIDFKVLNYSELIPIMVRALQEQEKEKEELLSRIEKLESIVSKLTSGETSNSVTNSNVLLQSVPNPSNNTAIIRYTLPERSARAQLVLLDATGRRVRTIQLNSSGVVNVDVSSLAIGIYTYSLIVDGKIVQTKKLTVER